MAIVSSKNISKLWCSIILVSSFLNAQNQQLNSMPCGFAVHGSEKPCGAILHSADNQRNNGHTQERTSYQTKTQFSETEISSYLKPYGVDSWVINKSTNSSIIIETYPVSVINNQSEVLGEAFVSIKRPNGSYLVKNHSNHNSSKMLI
jgi:hypothetical protein